MDAVAVEAQIATAVADGRLVESRGGLYLPVFYKAEKEGAGRLAELSAVTYAEVPRDLIPPTSRLGHNYTPAQLDAIATALRGGVSVLTGGPGSGKTTVLKGVIEALAGMEKRVVLCAPTGRAAKRMSALTGHAATTIHSLLGYRQGEGYRRVEIDADVLIIDEGSMMEQVLFNHLLAALRPGTGVILVGDVDQLPAIGAGDVLRDLIDSGVVPVVRLCENFRQAAGSGIAAAARAINAGRLPEEDPREDFVIIEESGATRIRERIVELMSRELPERRDLRPSDILVVTPQQIGPLGARMLNTELQRRLNPDAAGLTRGSVTLRLGDPVMQRTNSRVRGVYNGETGRVTEVDAEAGTLGVEFSDGRHSTYTRTELGELTLAYATSVHKLQGSEARNIIFVVTTAHRPMLYRNLLYTGVSRATDLCIIIGEPEALRHAIRTNPTRTRNTNFKQRLRKRFAQLRVES
ncbi:MAG: AAA family ATPase [Duncaniella sp.]|nr:AAA family ATPase [Duncaniella sp.]